MGVPRSSYYAAPKGKPAEDAALAEIRAVTEACPAYGSVPSCVTGAM
jgi:hypothetical protein